VPFLPKEVKCADPTEPWHTLNSGSLFVQPGDGLGRLSRGEYCAGLKTHLGTPGRGIFSLESRLM
jgi:hypothetical protein